MIKPLDFAGEFEPAFIDGVKEIFEDKIVFNRVLGLRITELRPTTVKARIEMRNDLIGHYAHNRIHGGVISACLDTMGGLACMVAIGARFDDRVTGRLDAFAPGSRKIHIDVDPSSIGKNVRADVGIVGDAGNVLEDLIAAWNSRTASRPPASSWPSC